MFGKPVKRNPGRKQHGCEWAETEPGGDVDAAERWHSDGGGSNDDRCSGRHNNLWNTGAELF